MNGSKSVYVASGLKNYAQVIEIQKRLAGYGLEIAFDWASCYKRSVDSGIPESEEEKKKLAVLEVEGVRCCDILFLILPSGRGANIEFGIAVGCWKKIVVFSPSEELDISFYKLPGTVMARYIDDGVDAVYAFAKL